MPTRTRTWLITGSSRGFGAALAAAVLRHGDNLVATARNVDQLDQLAASCGDRVRTVSLDVTDPQAARDAVAVAVGEFGGLDVVVNNAGYANSAAIEDMTDEDLRGQIDTNLFGVINVTRAALPVLRAQRSGMFVQFSSVGGRVGGTPGMGAYQTAKFAVEGFSEVLAAELEPLGVGVLIVEPGAFRTDWQGSSMVLREVSADYQATVGSMNDYRRTHDCDQPGDPERAAQVLLETLDRPDRPRRLLLGRGAVDLAVASGRQRTEEARTWASVSAAADFPSINN